MILKFYKKLLLRFILRMLNFLTNEPVYILILGAIIKESKRLDISRITSIDFFVIAAVIFFTIKV